MPTYIFRNMNTGKEYDKFMSNAEREIYLKTHPLITQLPSIVAVVGDHIFYRWDSLIDDLGNGEY